MTYFNPRLFVPPGNPHYLRFIDVDLHAILPSSVNQSVLEAGEPQIGCRHENVKENGNITTLLFSLNGLRNDG